MPESAAAPEPAAQPIAGTTAFTVPAGMRLQLVADSAEAPTPSPREHRRAQLRRYEAVALALPIAASLLAVAWFDRNTIDVEHQLVHWVASIAAGLLAIESMRRAVLRKPFAAALALALVTLVAGGAIAFFWHAATDFERLPSAFEQRDTRLLQPTRPGGTIAGAGWYCTATCWGGPVPLVTARAHGFAATAGTEGAPVTSGGWTCGGATCFGGPLPALIARQFGAHPTTAATTPTAIHGVLTVSVGGNWRAYGTSGYLPSWGSTTATAQSNMGGLHRPGDVRIGDLTAAAASPDTLPIYVGTFSNPQMQVPGADSGMQSLFGPDAAAVAPIVPVAPVNR